MLQYASTSLLIDTDHAAQFVNSTIPLRPLLSSWPGTQWRNDVASIVAANQPFPNIGQLVWPQGATRFALGAFLVSKRQWEQIEGNIQDGDPSDLKIGTPDDSEHYLELKMWALPPIKLSWLGIGEENASINPLYLMLLVDKRYWWQTRRNDLEKTPLKIFDPPFSFTKGCDGLAVAGTIDTHSWKALADAAKNALAIEIDPPYEPETQYVFDANTIWDLQGYKGFGWRSWPEIIDLICWNMGCQFVAKFDGKYEFMEWDTSRSNFLSNIAGERWTRIAGWRTLDSRLIVPEAIEFIFPSVDSQTGWFTGAAEHVTFKVKELQETAIPDGVVGQLWQIKDTAKASIKNGVCINREELVRIAKKTAVGLYRRLEFQADLVFANICNVELSGHADVVTFTYRSGNLTTRMQTPELNSWPVQMNHGSIGAPTPLDELQHMTTTSGNAGGSNEAEIVGLASRGKFTVYSPLGPVANNRQIITHWSRLKDQWLVIAEACP